MATTPRLHHLATAIGRVIAKVHPAALTMTVRMTSHAKRANVPISGLDPFRQSAQIAVANQSRYYASRAIISYSFVLCKFSLFLCMLSEVTLSINWDQAHCRAEVGI